MAGSPTSVSDKRLLSQCGSSSIHGKIPASPFGSTGRPRSPQSRSAHSYFYDVDVESSSPPPYYASNAIPRETHHHVVSGTVRSWSFPQSTSLLTYKFELTETVILKEQQDEEGEEDTVRNIPPTDNDKEDTEETTVGRETNVEVVGWNRWDATLQERDTGLDSMPCYRHSNRSFEFTDDKDDDDDHHSCYSFSTEDRTDRAESSPAHDFHRINRIRGTSTTTNTTSITTTTVDYKIIDGAKTPTRCWSAFVPLAGRGPLSCDERSSDACSRTFSSLSLGTEPEPSPTSRWTTGGPLDRSSVAPSVPIRRLGRISPDFLHHQQEDEERGIHDFVHAAEEEEDDDDDETYHHPSRWTGCPLHQSSFALPPCSRRRGSAGDSQLFSFDRTS